MKTNNFHHFKIKNKDIKSLIHQANSTRQDFKIIFDETKPQHCLPISIINGKEKGKVFTLLAGIHGCEYPPIIALQEIIKEIQPQSLKGSLIMIPIANIEAFYQRTPFVHPDDKKNLNYIFPGKADGSISEQIAHWITQNIIPNTDIFVDIHGGDANEDLIPFACYYDDKRNEENTQKALELAKASGLPYIVSYPYTIKDDEPALYAFKQAVQNNIIALSLEAGKLGNLQEDAVQLLKTAVWQMLDFSQTYPNPNDYQENEKKRLSQQTYIKAQESGIFYSSHKSGDFIKKNEEMGYITDEFGNFLCKITSPTDGIILYKIGTPPVNKGETVFCIGSK
ncbi:MAG: M14 family metallopeptidase [Flavobacteriaceae bacterium]|nr:M14 family metallopeptidase [Flavobacteriaceae bacterium]